MTPTQAGALMRRARLLLRAGGITHHQLAILDCMVWSCRVPGSDRLSVSYKKLQRLAHVARDTVARGVARLEAAGLIQKVKRRVRVAWLGAVASRQATNVYVLSTESAQQPVYRGRESSFLPLYSRTPAVERGPGRKNALEEALTGLRGTLSAAWRSRGDP